MSATISGPDVMKLSRKRTHSPNLTPCSKFSYSRSRGYRTFLYSYSYSSGVQISVFSSRLQSLLRTILKAVSVRNIFSNEIYRQNLTNNLNSTSVSPNIICFTLLLFGENKRKGVYNVHLYTCIWLKLTLHAHVHSCIIHKYILLVITINTHVIIYMTRVQSFGVLPHVLRLYSHVVGGFSSYMW